MADDVISIILNDRPEHWPELPDAVKAKLLAGGMYSPAERTALNRAVAVYAFLIRNEPIMGTIKRCSLCNAKHPYVTIGCVPAPFNGLREALTWLSTNELGLTEGGLKVDGYIRPGMLVPISKADADKLNQAIRDKRRRTVNDQAPPRPAEVNAGALETRLHRRAAATRPFLVRS